MFFCEPEHVFTTLPSSLSEDTKLSNEADIDDSTTLLCFIVQDSYSDILPFESQANPSGTATLGANEAAFLLKRSGLSEGVLHDVSGNVLLIFFFLLSLCSFSCKSLKCLFSKTERA